MKGAADSLTHGEQKPDAIGIASARREPERLEAGRVHPGASSTTTSTGASSAAIAGRSKRGDRHREGINDTEPPRAATRPAARRPALRATDPTRPSSNGESTSNKPP